MIAQQAAWLALAGDAAGIVVLREQYGARMGEGPLAAEVGRWRADLNVVSSLEELRLRQAAKPDILHGDQSYRQAFGAYGLAVEAEPDEAVRLIQASAVRSQLVVGLHDWVWTKLNSANSSGLVFPLVTR